jgi:hypothetical protein
MHAFRGQVDLEELDGDKTLPLRVVRPKDRSQGPRTNLMKNTKRSERIWRWAGGFGVQRRTPQRKARSW